MCVDARLDYKAIKDIQMSTIKIDLFGITKVYNPLKDKQ